MVHSIVDRSGPSVIGEGLPLSQPWLKALAERIDAIERVRLGSRHVLYSPASGAILMTDELGLAVLSDPMTPKVGADLPRAVLDEILREWKEAGLFDEAQLPFPDPVLDCLKTGLYNRCFVSTWGTVTVETDDPALLRELDELLWAFSASKESRVSHGLTIRCISCAEGGFGVFIEGRALWGRATTDVARYLIVREAAEALAGADRVGAVLHGAAVLHQGSALLILGESGRGKSTLAQGMVDAGCGFLADDHLPLHVDGRQLLAFPSGSAVKEGARNLSEVRRLTALHGQFGSSRDGVCYLPIEPAVAPGTAVPITAIVFPVQMPGAELTMTRMAPEEAFVAAIGSGSRPSRQRKQITSLARLFDAVPAFTLRYGTSAQSVPACLDVFAG